MDGSTLDARLPILYRRILDGATELERRGLRSEALRLRRRASSEYASWDERAERRMLALLDGVGRHLHEAAPRDGLVGRVRSRIATRAGSRVVQASARPEPSG